MIHFIYFICMVLIFSQVSSYPYYSKFCFFRKMYLVYELLLMAKVKIWIMITWHQASQHHLGPLNGNALLDHSVHLHLIKGCLRCAEILLCWGNTNSRAVVKLFSFPAYYDFVIQKKDYEVALVGAFKREREKEAALQALTAENQAAMQLVCPMPQKKYLFFIL